MRFTSVLGLSVLCALVVGVAARPFKHKGKHDKESLQGVIEFEGEQVEPPEDQDAAGSNPDPGMTSIWKSGRESWLDQLALKPEEDLDALYHPSLAGLKRQVGRHALPVDDFQQDTLNVFEVKGYQEPEEDRDAIAHPRYDQQAREKMAERLADLVLLMSLEEVRVDSQPEKDMDDLYHKDVPAAAPYLRHGKAAAPEDVPLQEYYSEPEADLDYLFHP